ncbi:hypothetical protein V6Z12_D06G101900 [Gossypium hirsutum]
MTKVEMIWHLFICRIKLSNFTFDFDIKKELAWPHGAIDKLGLILLGKKAEFVNFFVFILCCCCLCCGLRFTTLW